MDPPQRDVNMDDIADVFALVFDAAFAGIVAIGRTFGNFNPLSAFHHTMQRLRASNTIDRLVNSAIGAMIDTDRYFVEIPEWKRGGVAKSEFGDRSEKDRQLETMQAKLDQMQAQIEMLLNQVEKSTTAPNRYKREQTKAWVMNSPSPVPTDDDHPVSPAESGIYSDKPSTSISPPVLLPLHTSMPPPPPPGPPPPVDMLRTIGFKHIAGKPPPKKQSDDKSPRSAMLAELKGGKVKLRPTKQRRSVGGTPKNNAHSSESYFRRSLRDKFMNAHRLQAEDSDEESTSNVTYTLDDFDVDTEETTASKTCLKLTLSQCAVHTEVTETESTTAYHQNADDDCTARPSSLGVDVVMR